MSLFYVSLPHLFVYIGDKRALVYIITIVLYLCTCLQDIRVHEETLGEKYCKGVLGFLSVFGALGFLFSSYGFVLTSFILR